MTPLADVIDPKNGRIYKAFKLDSVINGNPDSEDINFVYELIDPKGRSWKLLRNKPNPAMMFAIPEDFVHGPKILDKRWFTDKNRDGTDCPLRFCA